MGAGRWSTDSFVTYNHARGRKVDTTTGTITGTYSAQQMYLNHKLSDKLNPKNVIRECCDTTEHPNTLPIMIALDVTGSMGSSAVEFAKKLNHVMTSLLEQVEDVEFMVAAIGDFYCDQYPFQAGQFESDIRIAEQLDEIVFEGGGGGNDFESYTAAWYFGAYHTKLDCWKRGKKGIIITIGDEVLNPYIPINGNKTDFESYMGDSLQKDIDTEELYQTVTEKYEVYHMVADHNVYSGRRAAKNVKSFANVIGEQNVSIVTLDTIADKIIEIVSNAAKDNKKREKIITGTAEDKKTKWSLPLISW